MKLLALAPQVELAVPWPSKLEVILKRKLDDAAAMLVGDGAKLIQGLLCKGEPAGRIAEVGPCATDPVRSRCYRAVANRIERKEDIACIRVAVAYPGRIGLVEYIEEPGSELDLLFSLMTKFLKNETSKLLRLGVRI